MQPFLYLFIIIGTFIYQSQNFFMQIIYRFLLLFFIVCNTHNSSGQDVIVPNVELKTKEDFVKTEKNIVAASNWLETTQLGKEMDKRTKINAFVLMWSSNSAEDADGTLEEWVKENMK